MQKRLLLVAVAVAVVGLNVGKASADGHYQMQGSAGLPDKVVPEFSRAPTAPGGDEGTEVVTTASADTTWTWVDGNQYEPAPTHWLKGTIGWSAATITTDAFGMEGRAYAAASYEGSLSALDPSTMVPAETVDFYLPGTSSRSEYNQGVKTSTIAAPEWGPVLTAFATGPLNPTKENGGLTIIGRLEAGVGARPWSYGRETESGRASLTISEMHAYGNNMLLTPTY